MIKNIFGLIKRKKLFVIGVIVLAIIIMVFFNPFKKENSGFKIEKVVRGNIFQEVSETGSVEAAEELNLGFKTSGRIADIKVKVGDTVERGAILASLDINQLAAQLNQYQASLAIAQSQYDKLIAGSTQEEIKVSQDVRDAAQDDLNGTYQDVLNILDDAYLKIYNAYNAVGSIQATYFGTSDQEGIKVQDNKTVINNNLNALKSPLDAAKESLNHNDIDNALSKAGDSLKNISNSLKIIRETCEQGIYYTKVSSTDKTSIDNQRSYIITALTNINNSQQTISSDKIALQKSEDDLVLKTAKPRQEDIAYYQAKVGEAQSQVSLLQTQINDAFLKSPIKGTVTKVDKKIGETIQSTELPFSVISLDPFQVKIDIYEEDIVKIKIGNFVDIKIAAFPNETLTGKVVSIDPAEKLIDEVVYYEVTVAFDQLKDGIKPGMTADVVIKTANKENALIVPKEAVRENGKTTVLVYKNSKTEEREVQIGLEGSDNRVEVVSGLSEGEEVAIE